VTSNIPDKPVTAIALKRLMMVPLQISKSPSSNVLGPGPRLRRTSRFKAVRTIIFLWGKTLRMQVSSHPRAAGDFPCAPSACAPAAVPAIAEYCASRKAAAARIIVMKEAADDFARRVQAVDRLSAVIFNFGTWRNFQSAESASDAQFFARSVAQNLADGDASGFTHFARQRRMGAPQNFAA
jgi:hypothetical protein